MGDATPGRPADASDHELLTRHANGDPEAFSELVRRHRDRLWAVALRTLGDREEAADALQEAFVSAYRAAHTFRGQAAVTTWLHRITVNACLDRIRKAKSRPAAPTPEPERLESLLEPHESAEVPVERQDLRRELRAALAELSEEQRAALVLVDMQGYPVAEAAEILGTPVGTIKSRCARGRARLLPLLSHLNPRADGSPPGNQASDPSVPPPRSTSDGGARNHRSLDRNDSEDQDPGETGAVRGGGGHA